MASPPDYLYTYSYVLVILVEPKVVILDKIGIVSVLLGSLVTMSDLHLAGCMTTIVTSLLTKQSGMDVWAAPAKSLVSAAPVRCHWPVTAVNGGRLWRAGMMRDQGFQAPALSACRWLGASQQWSIGCVYLGQGAPALNSHAHLPA